MARSNARKAGDVFNISDPEDFQVKKLKNFDLGARGAGSGRGTERLSKFDLENLNEVGGFTKQELIDYANKIDPDPGASGGKAQGLLNKWKAELAAGTKPAPETETKPAPDPEPEEPNVRIQPYPYPEDEKEPDVRIEKPAAPPSSGDVPGEGGRNNSGNATNYSVIQLGDGQAQTGRIEEDAFSTSADVNIKGSRVGGDVINGGIAINNSQAFTQMQGAPDTRAIDNTRFSAAELASALQGSTNTYSDYGSSKTFEPPPSLDGKALSDYTAGFGHMFRDRATVANAGLRFN